MSLSTACQRKTTACTVRIDRNLQWHRAVSMRQHGSCFLRSKTETIFTSETEIALLCRSLNRTSQHLELAARVSGGSESIVGERVTIFMTASGAEKIC